ncbi:MULTISPECIES: DUF1648 domain-containing protein [unclassified Dietzia]|uniref:DUF1648 domain-containing protein n=1 Tax=unclassified Dietzia TaxID=2617939 RepID=UPI000D223091|nr:MULTISPECIES: DUF1648 domain-containing protein [unclassified Dietzia]AVZ40448.1 hypothetical protein CT688_14210 [Dietzia sp. JS16-p6b]QGW25962.1 hypothetical protein GJR88_04513 [Dietzia sp. DQ12-45-1b]
MTTTNSVADEARGLPREPSGPWIRALVVSTLLIWLAVLAWQVMVLPERVPIHFGSGGRADGWSGKAGALAFSGVLPLTVLALVPLTSLLVLRAPELINGPNKQWWTSTASRLRRFERLVREDLWLIVVVTLALLVAMQVGIVIASESPDQRMPGGLLLGGTGLFGAGMVAVLLRMYVGDRYAEDPDLD